jgi:hypothetical protein
MNIKNINAYNVFWLCHKILGIMSIIYFVYIVYFACTFVLYSNTEGICTNNKCTFPKLAIYNYDKCVGPVSPLTPTTPLSPINLLKDTPGTCYYCIQIHDYIYVSTKNNECINLYTILTSILYYFTIPTIIKLIFFYNYQRIANKIIFYNQIINVNTLQTPLLQQFYVCYLCFNQLNKIPCTIHDVIIKTQCNHYYCYDCMIKWKNSNCTHCPKCLCTIYL